MRIETLERGIVGMIKPPLNPCPQLSTYRPTDYRLDRAINLSFQSMIQPVVSGVNKNLISYPVRSLPTRLYYPQPYVQPPTYQRGILPFNQMMGPGGGFDPIPEGSK